MEACDDSRPREYFPRIPKIGFKYGPDEYGCTSSKLFSIGEQVSWCPTTTQDIYYGKIEYIGEKYPQTSLESSSLIAVVAFSKPTCHLPGHLTNPPCYRNVVSLEKLKKLTNTTGDNQLEIHKEPKPVEIYGNCIAKKKFDQNSVSDYKVGECLFIATAERGILGKIKMTGDIVLPTGPIKCVGLHWEDSIEEFASLLKFCHDDTNDNEKCAYCAGGTLAFIPIEYVGNKEFCGFEIGKGTIADLKLAQTRITNKGRKDKSWLFLGNCVARIYGYNETSDSHCKIGSKVNARKGNKFVQGVVARSCTINDTAGIGDNIYVCIRFATPIEDLNLSKDAVLHSGQPGSTSETCSICKGVNIVYVPASFLPSRGAAATENKGIIFSVLN